MKTTVPPLVVQYLRLVREENGGPTLDEPATPEWYHEARDKLWDLMTKEQRDQTNDLVLAVFGDVYGLD